MSGAESLARVSNSKTLSLVFKKKKKERLVGLTYCILITQAALLMYPQTDLGRWKRETAARST